MKDEHKIFYLIVSLGLFIWVADAFLDSVVFYNQPFLASLIYDVPNHEIYMRLFSFVCFCIFGIVISIMLAKRKQATEAFLESERKHRALFETMAQGVVYQDNNGNIISANPSAEKILGLSLDQIKGSHSTDPRWKSVHEDGSDFPGETHPSMIALKTGKEVKNTIMGVLNSEEENCRWIMINAVPQFREGEDKPYQVYTTFDDITALKNNETALKESEARYKSLVELSPEAVFVHQEGIIVYINPAGTRIFGATDYKEFIGKPALDLIHPDYHEIVKGRIRQAREEKTTLSPAELKYIRLDNKVIDVMATATYIDYLGKPSILSVIKDITDQKAAQTTLREKDLLNQLLLDALPCVALLLKPSTREIVASNEAGRKAGAIPGKHCFSTWGQRGDPCPWCLAPKLWETGKAQHLEVDAIDIIWDAHWFPIDEDLYLHYAFDITENRKMLDKLHRAQKMESMGLMAGGVAHDLNNILSGIVSYPELILMNLPEDSPLRKPIKTIQESGMRAADVVEDLLTMARGVASSKEPLNLSTMVEEYLQSAEYQKLEKTHSFVNFKTKLDPDLLNISGSPIHIKKILMNLVTNASEAIEGSGTVTVSTVNQYLDEPLKGYEDVRTGEYVVLTVSDDGTGISPGDLENIFEPFYTKKVMGKSGTGLGLAVVWNTVQDHDGYINVKSSEKGTVFELYFPVTREEVAAEGEEVPLEDYLGHGERVLVVDDEERQREIARGMLTELGYNAESVSSGEEAIEYVKEHPVDLIVLDMVMPRGINGRQTYEEIIKIRPGQKAVIASGYAKSKEVDIAQGLGAGKYIKKPYILEKIGIAVKEELEK